ncbi:MAG: (deoxy)nucleoside triphosphate pyrophosphohydrolase [Bacteroidota bacterium]
MIKIAVGVIWRDGSVLLCQRKKSAKYPLKWEFPGGKIESGETPEVCLRRELLEELAITATIGKELHRQHIVYADSGSYDVKYYLVRTFEGVPENRAFSRIQWVDIADLQLYDVLEGNLEVIRKISKNPFL